VGNRQVACISQPKSRHLQVVYLNCLYNHSREQHTFKVTFHFQDRGLNRQTNRAQVLAIIPTDDKEGPEDSISCGYLHRKQLKVGKLNSVTPKRQHCLHMQQFILHFLHSSTTVFLLLLHAKDMIIQHSFPGVLSIHSSPSRLLHTWFLSTPVR